jgi:predicted dehydrogenase
MYRKRKREGIMRQVFLQKGAIVVKDVCRPLLDDYSALVSVYYSFISTGTEMATIQCATSGLLSNIPRKIKKVLESVAKNGVEGTKALIRGKLKGNIHMLGYSCSGRVIAVGKKVKNLRVGDYVACAGAGLANHADIVSVPENLTVKLRDKDKIKEASLATIGSIALQGIRRAQLQLGETVCIIGLGLLGQITVQLAKLSGCKVIGIDLIPERIRLAQKRGACAGFHSTLDDLKQEIAFLTEHHGVDTTIITAASKSDSIVQQAMEVTRKKGRVVVVGDVGLNIQRCPFYKKEIDFLISCSYGPGRYDTCYEKEGIDYPYAYVRWTENRNMQAFVELLEQGQINVTDLITDEVSLESIEKAYDSLKSVRSLGVVLNYLPKDDQDMTHQKIDPEKQPDIIFRPVISGKIRVGFIGAGGFSKIKLMPTISRLGDLRIQAVVDADITAAKNASKLYGAARTLVDDSELFKEDLVDAVVIATPHKFHCAQIINALRNGKAVFCEKPMVTDFNQLHTLTEFLTMRSRAPFCVDYNRSFAPYIEKIKRVIEGHSTPLIIQYRMNAGYIPGDHWVQTDFGAGRIIGEACHIFDLFCYLTDADPIAVSVESLGSERTDLFATDNFCAQVSFDDGSVCSLLYTALGHVRMGKERMELFFDGKSIVMNDYKELIGFGLTQSFNEKTKSPDKGHARLLKLFFEGIKNEQKDGPISFERMHKVAHLTLIVDRLARGGGGQEELKN